MPLKLEKSDWRAIFPNAPMPVINAFAANAAVLNKAGITATRTRLAYALANVEHECGGFTIKDLTENINYTAERMAAVWPSRFPKDNWPPGTPNPGDPDKVRAKFGTGPGWRKRAFDDIYGNRLGNKPGTSDGSTYIGRGGPQITGRNGYKEVGARCGLNLVDNPDLATLPENQPAVLAAFWTWKDLNKKADDGDFIGCVKAWNGGTNGLADRKVQLAGNDPIISRLSNVASVLPLIG